MSKWSIRDLRARRTEKKAMKPEVRNILLSLDGVYEQRKAPGTEPEGAREQAAESARKASES